jgi:uncharacterized membrane protein
MGALRPFFVLPVGAAYFFGGNMNRTINTRTIALSGVLAALYAVITIAWPLSYGSVQFRISEALCVLPAFAPVTSIGLFIGCLIANLFSPVSALDIVVGSAATLIGCLWTTRCKRVWTMPLPTIVANTVLVGAMLAWVYTPDALVQGFLVNGASVAFGEAVVLYVLGVPLAIALQRTNLLARAKLTPQA